MLLWYTCLVPLCVSVSSVCVCVCVGGDVLGVGNVTGNALGHVQYIWLVLNQGEVSPCSSDSCVLYASLYGTYSVKRTLQIVLTTYTHTYLCMWTCDNLHLLYCTITHSYHHHHHSAPMLATTQQLQKVFTVCCTVITVYCCVGYVQYVHSSVYSCNSWLVCEEMSLMTLCYCSCYLLVVTYQTARYWEL